MSFWTFYLIAGIVWALLMYGSAIVAGQWRLEDYPLVWVIAGVFCVIAVWPMFILGILGLTVWLVIHPKRAR